MPNHKQISIIVAIDNLNGIGKNNKLLCHLTEDLKRFKKITSGHTVVMGRNTYLSLPVKPLPHRKNIIITDNPCEHFDNCICVHSIEQAIEMMDEHRENFVIGGASIYKQFFPLADKLYITKIFHTFEADTFFPQINPLEWKLIHESEIQTDPNNGIKYQYLIYSKNH